MSDLWAAIDATWAAPRTHACGPFTLREGQGGGQRVSSATTEEPVQDADIARAAETMRALGQTPLFMVRGDQTDLDRQLAAAGYVIKDPVVILEAPVGPIADDPPPPVSVFPIWPPLHIMTELWAEGGIGPERINVMNQSTDPKTAVMGRAQDRAVGCGFVAVHDGVAVIHALEVTPVHRRQGAARNMVRGAALWARDHGATRITTLVTRANAASLALFASLGFRPAGQYHYRIAPEETPPE